jgi:hypothetical protein
MALTRLRSSSGHWKILRAFLELRHDNWAQDLFFSLVPHDAGVTVGILSVSGAYYHYWFFARLALNISQRTAPSRLRTLHTKF